MSNTGRLLLTILIADATLASVALLWEHNLTLLAVMSVIALFALLVERSKIQLLIFIICGGFGAFAECVAIFFGAWHYTNPDLINFPVWLIIVWGVAGIFVVRIYMIAELAAKKDVKKHLTRQHKCDTMLHHDRKS